MKAIALCAGFATRLYPLTKDRAKPLLPVAGRPVLSYLADQLFGTGAIDEIVVVSNGRFAPDFEAWAGETRAAHPGHEVRVLDDGALTNDTRLGAVRDLAFALEHTGIPEDGALVVAGDNLFRCDFGEIVGDYRAKPRNLVVAHRQPDLEKLRRTGVAEVDEDGRVVRMWEKPQEPPSDVSCTPLYLLESSALRLVPEFVTEAPDADAPGNFIAWLATRAPVFIHLLNGERLDLGSLEAWNRAASWLANG